ncbi:MAG TPA: hypothetical protein VLW17_12175 [Thermoanaerobaculaceae bacterium]|nr:hypothetical protein [Thermoanaerobaculaceae bacterium]
MRRFGVGLVALGVVPLLASCLAGRPVTQAGDGSAADQALGSFEVASRTLGDATFSPAECSSGDPQLFLGVDFAEPGRDLILRLAVDPLEGPGVRLYSATAPFDRSVVFRRADCSVFHFSLDSTGWRVNRVEDYRVTLELDCARPGERVRGRASSTHCH